MVSFSSNAVAYRRDVTLRRAGASKVLFMFMLAFVLSALILKRQYNVFNSLQKQQQHQQQLQQGQLLSRMKPEWPCIPVPLIGQVEAVSLEFPSVSDLWHNISMTIPANIWFTYKHDILKNHEPDYYYNNVQNTIAQYSLELLDQVEKIHVTCMDNDYCLALIQAIYPDLVPYFLKEKEGCYKGDICRLAALYLYGGYYFDVDIEVIEPLVVSPPPTNHVSFMTSIDLNQVGMFQAFLVASPRHPLIKANLDAILIHYRHRPMPGGYVMGPMTLAEAYRAMVGPDIARKRNLPHDKWERIRPQPAKNVANYHNYSLEIAKYIPKLLDEAKEFDRSILLLQEMNLTPNYNLESKRRKRPEGDEYTTRCNVIVADPETSTAYFFARVVGSDNCPFVQEVDKDPSSVNTG